MVKSDIRCFFSHWYRNFIHKYYESVYVLSYYRHSVPFFDTLCCSVLLRSEPVGPVTDFRYVT